MIKFLARHIKFLQLLTDCVCIIAAWAFAYWIRFKLFDNAQSGMLGIFAFWLIPLASLTIYFLLKTHRYEFRRQNTMVGDVMELFRENAVSILAFIVLLYFFSENRISRLTLLMYAVFSTLLLILARAAVRSLLRKVRRRGELITKTFVVTKKDRALNYLSATRYTPGTGIKVAAVFGDPVLPINFPCTVRPIEDLDEMIHHERPDLVVLALPEEDQAFVSQFIGRNYDQLFQIQIINDEKHVFLGMTTEVVDDIHLMSLNQLNFSDASIALKRAIDLIGSGVGLIVLSPLFIVTAISIKISSKGPVFFSQDRVGLNGQIFRMWKFRSMKVAEPGQTIGWTVENDPRRTRVGTFLRRTSIDELPQLWNVFCGDMSLVGPRPEQGPFVEKFRKEIPAYMLRHKMKAGITGWAQVNGWRGDTSLYKRIECDLFYIRNWSVWFDVKIIFLTLIKGFINKNAY